MPIRPLAATLAALATLVTSSVALAHIEIPDIGIAGKSQVITFNVGHGCSGSDTVAVEVKIPAEVTTVRGVPSFFGYADVKTDDSGAVTSVVWTKDTARMADDQFYQLQLRIKVPDMPFTTLYFEAVQHCRDKDGNDLDPVDWVGQDESDSSVEPAPALHILPPTQPGWNKITAATDVADLSVFDNAQIVWVGDSAYSSNPTTKDLIAAENGVSTLDSIRKDDEIWVKY